MFRLQSKGYKTTNPPCTPVEFSKAIESAHPKSFGEGRSPSVEKARNSDKSSGEIAFQWAVIDSLVKIFNNLPPNSPDRKTILDKFTSIIAGNSSGKNEEK